LLKQTGASGVIHKGNGVQIIYGPTVTVVKSNLDEYLDIHTEEQQQTFMLQSHLDGMVVTLDSVEDEVFSQGILGNGIAVIPENGVVKAPCDGVVSNIVSTKHAVGIKSDDGFDILIHVGIDTVNLKGRFFEYHVQEGQKIKQGDTLITFDIDAIKKEGYNTVTPMVISNTDEYSGINIVASGRVKAGEELIEILF